MHLNAACDAAARTAVAVATRNRVHAATNAAATAAALCTSPAAHAHTTVSSVADPLTFAAVEPWVVGCLAISALLYAIGLRRVWRGATGGRHLLRRRALAFGAGWLVLTVALVPPLDGLGTMLFSGHMVQHELLMIVAAPLLVLGHPLGIWVWALPPRWRRTTGAFFHAPAWRGPWKVVTAPLAAWLLHALVLWVWHAPALFDAALRHPAIHVAQHIAFLATALLFWWSVLGSASRPRQGVALLSLFTTTVHTGALGALLALASTPWYRSYLASTRAFGLEPLQDQQLGGLVMWVPGALAYLIAALWLAARWIGPSRPGTGTPVAGLAVLTSSRGRS